MLKKLMTAGAALLLTASVALASDQDFSGQGNIAPRAVAQKKAGCPLVELG